MTAIIVMIIIAITSLVPQETKSGEGGGVVAVVLTAE